MIKKIGILGGTFDPIHVGHLRLAIEAREQLALDEVRFIPCYQPVHRAPATSSHMTRVALLSAALNDMPHCVIDTREIDRGGPSYMVDTLRSLHTESPTARFYLLMGSDSWQTFTSWHAGEEILRLAHIVVGQRPGVITTDKPPFLLSMPELAVSSTLIREKLSRRESIRYLVPPAIESLLLHEETYANN